MTEDIETKIYNLIKEQETNPVEFPDLFVLVNHYEIGLLKENNIIIKNISYHHYESRDKYNSFKSIIDKCEKDNYQGKTYLLGTGPLNCYYLKDFKNPNVILEFNFNSLKYLSMYGDELVIKRYTNVKYDESEEEEMNRVFVETLKNNYKRCLFYCPYNAGIIGVEGYFEFYDKFYKYMDTIDTIYVINSKYARCKFLYWLEESKYQHKIKKLEICVGKLYQTNPELIAYYRAKKDTERDNFFELYQIPYQSLNVIDDDIFIGTDSYRHIYYDKRYKKEECMRKNWFPEEEISHIINVSDELLQDWEIPNDVIIYEHYPISEREKDNMITKDMLERAAKRIHELITQKAETGSNKRIYVHCSLGMNRSPAAVLFYLMKYRGMSLYDAYKYIALKRRIFTSVELFDILYEEACSTKKDVISPLKLRTHYAWNFCEPTAFMFSFYDLIKLEELYGF